MAALQSLFRQIQPDLGIAYVVIMHLEPHRATLLPQILAACTTMPAEEISGPTQLAPDHIYIIPPNRQLVVTDSSIVAQPFAAPRGSLAAIDSYFRSPPTAATSTKTWRNAATVQRSAVLRHRLLPRPGKLRHAGARCRARAVRKLGDEGTLRAWVVGCATGEESYSLAMLLMEEAHRRQVHPQIQIFATDLDEGALATARAARYPASIQVDVSPDRLQHFFVHEGSTSASGTRSAKWSCSRPTVR